MKEYRTTEQTPRDWDKELCAELGDTYLGCTVANGKLIELRVKTDLTTSKKNNLKTKFGVDLI